MPIRRLAIVLLLVGAHASPASQEPTGQSIRVGEKIEASLSAEDPEIPGQGLSRRFVLTPLDSGLLTISLDSFDFDVSVRVERPEGEPVAEDDDSGLETNARLILRVAAGASYRVVVISKHTPGEFVLSVALGEPNELSGDAFLDAAIAFRATAGERAQAQGRLSVAVRHHLFEGDHLSTRKRFEDAIAAYESALTLARQCDDRFGEAGALGRIGSAWRHLGRTDRAMEALQACLALAREIQDRDLEVAALGNLGRVAQVAREFEAAREYQEQTLAIAREIGNRSLEAATLNNLGLAYDSLGDLARAHSMLEQCISLQEELGDRAGMAGSLGDLGLVFLSEGDFSGARSLFEQALALAREVGAGGTIMRSLGNLANVAFSERDYERAKELDEQALAMSLQLRDKEGEKAALSNLAVDTFCLGDYSRGRSFDERYLALARDLDPAQGELNALRNQASRYRHLGHLARARELQEQILGLAHETGDALEEGRALVDLANLCSDVSQFQEAREHLEQALQIFRKHENQRGEAVAIGSLAVVQMKLGEPALALPLFEERIALSRELGDRRLEVGALNNLAGLHASLGDYRKARELSEEILARAREWGDLPMEARALGNIATTHSNQGEYTLARQSWEQQLALTEQLGLPSGQGMALAGLGLVHRKSGDYRRALACHEKALALFREVGNGTEEARALGNLGNDYSALGDTQKAQHYLEAQLSLARRLGDRVSTAQAIGNLGSVYSAQREFERAREAFETRLEMARRAGSQAGEAMALGNLGKLFLNLNDLEKARGYLEQCLSLARASENRSSEDVALTLLGEVAFAAGDHSEARDRSLAAIELAEEQGDRSQAIYALGGLARSSIALGDAESALEALETAERRLSGLSAAGLDPLEAGMFRSLFSGFAMIFQDLTWLRLERAGAAGEARAEALHWGFAAAGRWKGRTLLEGIAEHRSGARSKEAIVLRRSHRETLASQGAVLQRIARATQTGSPAEEIEQLRSEATEALSKVQRLADQLRRVSPRDATLDRPEGTTPEVVRRSVLAPGEVLVSYVEGEQHLYAYVLDEWTLELIDLGERVEIRTEVEQFLEGILNPVSLAPASDVARLGSFLFERLLAPALAAAARSADQPPIKRLCLLPSALLASLPFEALVLERTAREPTSFSEVAFVIDRYEVTYGPSTPILVELAATGPRRGSERLLVLADPQYPSEEESTEETADAGASSLVQGRPRRTSPPSTKSLARLPGTRAEALTIASLVLDSKEPPAALRGDTRNGSLVHAKIEVQLGQQASRSRLERDLRNTSILHLACHGIIDTEEPGRSGIALSPEAGDDGWFTISDALELDLDCNLVVLSACQTARGESYTAGVESLARAFLYAGARAVVASLWQVSDWTSAETMRAFYEGALKEGLSPARALRRAKLAVRQGRIRPGSSRGVTKLGVTKLGVQKRPTTDAGHPFYWAPFIHIGLDPKRGAKKVR